MSSIEELEQRVAALEEQVGQESGLRASQDRDLSSMASALRAHQHTIQALAITQADHNEQISRLREEHGAKLDQIILMLSGLIDGQQ